MDWIDLSQDRDRWRDLVHVVTTFGCHKLRGISWLAEILLVYQEGLCSMKSKIYYHKNWENILGDCNSVTLLKSMNGLCPRSKNSGAKSDDSIPYISQNKNPWNLTCFTHHTFLRHAAHSVVLTLLLCYMNCSVTYPPCREGLFVRQRDNESYIL
jgi:hypothetical protein